MSRRPRNALWRRLGGIERLSAAWTAITPPLAVVGALVTSAAVVAAGTFVWFELEERRWKRQWTHWTPSMAKPPRGA